MTRVAVGIALVLLASTIRPSADTAEGLGPAVSAEKGVTCTTVLDNETLSVTRCHLAPGSAHTLLSTVPAAVVAQISPGDVQIDQVGDNSRGRREAGDVWFVPAGIGSHFVNIGRTTFDHLAIVIKRTRPLAPAAPATAAPPGITRTTLIDNDDVRVVRATFASTGREPVHTHPNDLLTMQISEGRVEILNGVDTSTADREPGFLQFLPRNVAHAFASADPKPFEILSVSIK